MVQKQFSHVRTWIFDLDNTLYPPATSLFPQIEIKMTAFMMQTLGVSHAEASALRTSYWRDHGTTLAGLMKLHGVQPYPYLEDVHDIDFTILDPAPKLRKAIEALPGRKIIFTNGTAPYAGDVLEARGLSGVFDATYGVEHANFEPKPNADAYTRIIEQDGLDPTEAAMFEDDPRNLEVPHTLGMKTVHVAPQNEITDRAYVHHHTDDLAHFLVSTQ
ncbi:MULTISPECIES: pyrimidine 5'-nucleotidase [Pacificibacter]|uniref:pyrimidine 5'-nucleotidase n=1 Tax=Pacificibacter TaxID=1042323 RepID=UPI001C0A47BE|nr:MULTISPECIES: pyrimidine 5'-nucleotidase [Pacificibacter]MBU2935344.1 pyrimidine 5'-nucleotidase [Pacificibacter marinus]MDO6615499.1 pyrimidine 5'-nucleotidase [Pacificibacter sp. 1_MG-2023]